MNGEGPLTQVRSPTVPIDRMGDICEELASLQQTVRDLKQDVNVVVREEVKQVKASVRLAYEKLEEDIEELRHDVAVIREIDPRSQSQSQVLAA